MTSIIYRTGRAAMRCWCEAFLCGEDRGHLAAVAELALDEITRVERMLSRFDPASEVFRLNAVPADVPFRVSPELFAIWQDCRTWWRKTNGTFDVTIQSTTGELTSDERWNAVRLDQTSHTITRTIDGITFDFGGYGKGYAIDRALAITRQYGIESACLHAGASSVVASGPPPDAAGWPIAIRHPDDETRIVAEWSLCDAGMSTSAVLCAGLPTPHSSVTEGLPIGSMIAPCYPGDLRSNDGAGSGDPRTTASSDTINPIYGRPLSHPASCTVLATSAAIAEVWSTALLVRRESTCDDAAVRRVLFVEQ